MKSSKFHFHLRGFLIRFISNMSSCLSLSTQADRQTYIRLGLGASVAMQQQFTLQIIYQLGIHRLLLLRLVPPAINSVVLFVCLLEVRHGEEKQTTNERNMCVQWRGFGCKLQTVADCPYIHPSVRPQVTEWKYLKHEICHLFFFFYFLISYHRRLSNLYFASDAVPATRGQSAASQSFVIKNVLVLMPQVDFCCFFVNMFFFILILSLPLQKYY